MDVVLLEEYYHCNQAAHDNVTTCNEVQEEGKEAVSAF